MGNTCTIRFVPNAIASHVIPMATITFTVGRHMLQNIYNRDQMGSP